MIKYYGSDHVEDPESLAQAKEQIHAHLLARGASSSAAANGVDLIVQLGRGFATGLIAGPDRDPLSSCKPQLASLKSALTRAAEQVADANANKELARQLEAHKSPLLRQATLPWAELPAELHAAARAAESLHGDIETRRGPDRDEGVRAFYQRYAHIYRGVIGAWPKGWKSAGKGGEPMSWKLLQAIVLAISERHGDRLTPKPFFSAIAGLQEKIGEKSNEETSDEGGEERPHRA